MWFYRKRYRCNNGINNYRCRRKFDVMAYEVWMNLSYLQMKLRSSECKMSSGLHFVTMIARIEVQIQTVVIVCLQARWNCISD